MVDLVPARNGPNDPAHHNLSHKEESIERDLATLILKLEELQHELIEKTLKPQEEKVVMSTEEQSAALCANCSKSTSSGSWCRTTRKTLPSTGDAACWTSSAGPSCAASSTRWK